MSRVKLKYGTDRFGRRYATLTGRTRKRSDYLMVQVQYDRLPGEEHGLRAWLPEHEIEHVD